MKEGLQENKSAETQALKISPALENSQKWSNINSNYTSIT